MSILKIYVDSSTKGSSGTKYGESIAAWMLQYSRSAIMARCGVAYFHRSGPNKTFYEGIIGALESALLAKDWRSSRLPPVVVVGDVPRGWRERTKLKHELEPGVPYTVAASSGEWYVRQFDFKIDELRLGYVLDFTRAVVPIGDFPTESACATRSPNDVS